MTTMQPWEKASDWSRTHFSLARLTYFLLISTIMWLKNCGKPCNLVCFFCQCTLEGTCGVLRSISIISLSFFPILSLSFIRFQDKTFKSQYWEAKPLLNFFPWPIFQKLKLSNCQMSRNRIATLWWLWRGVRSDAQLSCTETRFQKCC